MTPSHPPFDDEAPRFDLRAGLPDAAAGRVAEAVATFDAGAGRGIVEIGAGTGQIGVEIRRRVSHYTAIDESSEMLAVLRARLAKSGLAATVHCANARDPWPVGDRSVGVVFGSRVWHWLDPVHVLAETRRIGAAEGFTLLLGRVQRDPDAPQELLRKEMLRALARQGFIDGGRGRGRQLIDQALRAGAERLPRQCVASWTRTKTLGQALAAWQCKQRLAGLRVPPAVRNNTLEELQRWTRQRFGNIDTAFALTETYVLDGARFSAR